MTRNYDQYVRAEWEQFQRPSRSSIPYAISAAAQNIRAVLDVGCGGGQELLPFAHGGALAVGIDKSEHLGHFVAPGVDRSKVQFLRATAEALPFRSGQFDLVICRLVLPYTDNRRALSEIARVLSPNGTVLLRIHHFSYYLRRLSLAALRADLPGAARAMKPLLVGLVYHATGRQMRSWETFQTRRLLMWEIARLGLTIHSLVPESGRRTPTYTIVPLTGNKSPSPSSPQT